MGLPWWLGAPYWTLAIILSAFYGWKARDIFQVKRPDESWAYLAHQAWFNSVGALSGWAALWLEAVRISWYATTGAQLQFGLTDVVLSIIAFIGVTGFMPTTIVGLIEGIRELAARVAGAGK